MDLSSNLDEYIRESIDHTLGLPVSTKTLELKFLASEELQHRLQDQIFLLQDRLKDKDQRIDQSRAEAMMSAQAVTKCIEENQRLMAEYEDLLNQRRRWEKECTLYEQDREALMEFGNEADERAKEAEIRATNVEDDYRRLADELKFYKREHELHMMNEARATKEVELLKQRINELENARNRVQGCDENHLACSQCSSLVENQEQDSSLLAIVPGDASIVSTTLEGYILKLVVSSVLVKANTARKVKYEVAENARSFLEAHLELESCQRLLKLWENLKPMTKEILALAAEVESLQQDKENLRINLLRAEEEVNVLFETHNMLDTENRKLLRQCTKDRHHRGSDGKHSSSTSANGKRKSSPKTTSSSPRPLSPPQQNSPNSSVHE